MGVRILESGGKAVLYDSVTDIAFGPVFYGAYEAREQAVHFLDWLNADARTLTPADLMVKYAEWRRLYTDSGGELTVEAMRHAVSLV